MSPVRHALITGGSGIVGSLLTRRLLGLGSKVTTVGTQSREPFERAHKHLVADLSLNTAVSSILDSMEEPPDVLVALAAAPSTGHLTSLTYGQLQDMLTVKVWTPGLLAYALYPEMARRGWGRVILTSGVAAHRPAPGFVGGAVANSGVKVLTEALAQEFSGSGVTANCVTPGAVASTRLDATKRALQRDGAATPGALERAVIVEPESLVSVFEFLISRASDGISGAEIVVDAGMLCSIPM